MSSLHFKPIPRRIVNNFFLLSPIGISVDLNDAFETSNNQPVIHPNVEHKREI